MGKEKRKKRARPRGKGDPAAADSRPKLWRRSWFPPALFALLSLVYFGEFVFSDKIVFGQDIGTDFHQGEGESIAQRLAYLDQPLWDGRMGGYPNSEEIRHYFFPTHFIFLFTANWQRQIGWRYILIVFAAGWAMYAYMRALGVWRRAALWAGVAYLSAPTFLSFTLAGQYAKMTVIALFPLMCFLLEKGMSTGRVGYFLGLSAVIALGIFSPHLQMLQYALGALGLYFLFRWVLLCRERGFRRALGRLGLFCLAVGLGLGLGAEGLLPAYLHVRYESKRGDAGAGGAGKSLEEQLAHARSWSLHPEEVGSLLVPEFGGFYDPRNQRDYYWGRNPFKLNSEYFGILVLLLALLAAPEGRRRPLVLFLRLLFVLVLAFTLGAHTPVHWLVFEWVPGARVLRTIGMAAFLFAFAACALAGLGLGRILQADARERALVGRRLLAAGGALAGLALLLALAPGGVVEGWIALLYPDIASHKRQIAAAGSGWLARGAFFVFLVAACGTALLYMHLRQKLSAGLLACGLCALALFDTWRIDRLFLRYEDPKHYVDIRRENPRTLAFLRRGGGHFRLFPVPGYQILQEPGGHLYGLEVVTGFNNFTLRRYDRLLREGGIQAAEEYWRSKYYRGRAIPYTDEALLRRLHPLLNLLNARYIVTPSAIQLHAEGFPEVFAAEKLRLYENRAALPWFYLAPSCRVMHDEAAIIELLAGGRVDARQSVVLEREPPPALAQGPVGDRAHDRVEVLTYDPREGYIRLEVQSGGPRLLVFSENYHPYWHALVDGREAEVYRANYVWKAVYVPAGRHQVEWRYRSRSVALARVLSLLSLTAMAGIGVREYRRRRKKATA